MLCWFVYGWFEQTLRRENRIADSSLLANLMHSATLFSSTTVLALGGLLALFGVFEKSADLFESLPFAQRSSQQLLEVKVVLLILLFVHAVVKFTWSVRQFNFVPILVGSLSPKEQVNDDDRRAAHSAAGILKLAGENFGAGHVLVLFCGCSADVVCAAGVFYRGHRCGHADAVAHGISFAYD